MPRGEVIQPVLLTALVFAVCGALGYPFPLWCVVMFAVAGVAFVIVESR